MVVAPGQGPLGPVLSSLWLAAPDDALFLQDPGASFDVNDQDPDPQPRYTQMNDNR